MKIEWTVILKIKSQRVHTIQQLYLGLKLWLLSRLNRVMNKSYLGLLAKLLDMANPHACAAYYCRDSYALTAFGVPIFFNTFAVESRTSGSFSACIRTGTASFAPLPIIPNAHAAY